MIKVFPTEAAAMGLEPTSTRVCIYTFVAGFPLMVGSWANLVESVGLVWIWQNAHVRGPSEWAGAASFFFLTFVPFLVFLMYM